MNIKQTLKGKFDDYGSFQHLDIYSDTMFISNAILFSR
jgi:hypothetical protein